MFKVNNKQGFPNGVDLWGDNLSKMAKNYENYKISIFGVVGTWGDKPIFRVLVGAGSPH